MSCTRAQAIVFIMLCIVLNHAQQSTKTFDHSLLHRTINNQQKHCDFHCIHFVVFHFTSSSKHDFIVISSSDFLLSNKGKTIMDGFMLKCLLAKRFQLNPAVLTIASFRRAEWHVFFECSFHFRARTSFFLFSKLALSLMMAANHSRPAVSNTKSSLCSCETIIT